VDYYVTLSDWLISSVIARLQSQFGIPNSNSENIINPYTSDVSLARSLNGSIAEKYKTSFLSNQ
jgi:hypothetical protein